MNNPRFELHQTVVIRSTGALASVADGDETGVLCRIHGCHVWKQTEEVRPVGDDETRHLCAVCDCQSILPLTEGGWCQTCEKTRQQTCDGTCDVRETGVLCPFCD